MPEGIVAAVLGPRCIVLEDRRAVQCVLRGKLLQAGAPFPVVVGDRVEYQALGGGQGVVERVHPRRTELRRSTRERLRRKGKRRAAGQEQVVLANAEQVVIVAAAREPGLDLAIIDRALALARASGLAPAICINKIDLADRSAIERLMAPYLRVGIPVLYVSASTGAGLDGLRRLLATGIRSAECGMRNDDESSAGHSALRTPHSARDALRTPHSDDTVLVSLLWGCSGVGKSTLTRALTGAEVKIGVWNARNPRGPHTTSDARLYALPDGGFLADTPGFDWLHLDTLADEEHPEEVLLPESALETRRCRFANCTHRGEPGCAVTRGVLAGGIDTRRYGRYLDLAAEVRAAPDAPTADRDVAIVGGELFYRLRPTDRDDFVEAWTGLGKTSWCYYWPFLRLYGFAPNREVLWREVAGNRCVFVARHAEGGLRLNLLFPPLGPSPETALPECAKLLKAVNGGGRAKIMWMDAEDANALRGIRGLRVRSKGCEYWYRPDEILEARGTRFRTLRHQLNRLSSAECGVRSAERAECGVRDVECGMVPNRSAPVGPVATPHSALRTPYSTLQVRPYAPSDLRDCLALLQRWHQEQGARYLLVLDREYTEAALRHYGEFAREELFGGVVEVDGVIRAFFMGGSLTRDVGHAFILKADVTLPGLSYFAHLELLRWLGDHPWVNGGGDLRSEGLRQFKTCFRPAELRPIYQAVLTW